MPATGRSQNEFVSVDSAPAGFSKPLPMWRAPGLIMVFTLISYAALLFLDNSQISAQLFYGGDFVLAPISGSRSLPLRAFIFCYMCSFALFATGRLLDRLKLGLDLVITYAAFCVLLDLCVILITHTTSIKVSYTVLEILSGFIGYAIYSMKLLERGNMPSKVQVFSKVRHPLRTLLAFLGAGLVSGSTAFFLVGYFPALLEAAKSVALLGGVGPGVFLFLPLTFLIFYAAARIDTAVNDQGEFAPSLTIIVPAHNEEYIISRTIRSIDKAAEKYVGQTTILILDNNSSDNTAGISADALDACAAATGRVVSVPTPGKSYALNAGLAATETEFVIRIDADTQVGPESLRLAMRRMKDPSVGVVGGLPFPPGGGPFDRARQMELIVKHGFYSVALTTVNCVVGVPGMFAAYRTELPRKLGGFVQGMNGEDTDMSMRIGELGYRLIVDPRIRFVSEVPATYHHMREQRLRWFRSVFHVSARCRDLIYGPAPSLRGKFMLPFMLVNTALRAMMLPMILFAIIVLFGPGVNTRDLQIQSAMAVALGAPAILAVLASLLNKEYKGIFCLPEYVAFRLLRSFFTMESNLTISIGYKGQHMYAPSERVRPAGKPDNQA